MRELVLPLLACAPSLPWAVPSLPTASFHGGRQPAPRSRTRQKLPSGCGAPCAARRLGSPPREQRAGRGRASRRCVNRALTRRRTRRRGARRAHAAARHGLRPDVMDAALNTSTLTRSVGARSVGAGGQVERSRQYFSLFVLQFIFIWKSLISRDQLRNHEYSRANEVWLAKLGRPHLQAQSSVATGPAAAAQPGPATCRSVLERARAPGYRRERTQARRKDDHPRVTDWAPNCPRPVTFCWLGPSALALCGLSDSDLMMMTNLTWNLRGSRESCSAAGGLQLEVHWLAPWLAYPTSVIRSLVRLGY